MSEPATAHNEDILHGRSSLSKIQDYLGEVVYGGIDGSVTTFAAVAGSVGAELSSAVILILGFANLLADGFAMSVGAFLSAKSSQQNYEKHRAIEYWEVDNLPDTERAEVTEIYRRKGLEEPLLSQVVDVICADRDRWVDVMMTDELGMIKDHKSPVAIGAVTYASFFLVGLIPLITYVWDYLDGFTGNQFAMACLLTSFGFITIGFLKSYVTETSKIKGILETLLLGMIAAGVAYGVGDFLEKLIA